jgi:Ca2+-binding EF-hand superfamily protein
MTGIDSNHDGKLQFEEFIDIMAAQMLATDASEFVELAYSGFDKDGDGKIGPEDLLATFHELGDDAANVDEIKFLIETFAAGDAMTKAEFTNWMNNP